MNDVTSLNWRSLNEQLTGLTEQQLKKMIDDEMERGKRASIIVRLHQRYTTLRAARERRELLARLG